MGRCGSRPVAGFVEMLMHAPTFKFTTPSLHLRSLSYFSIPIPAPLSLRGAHFRFRGMLAVRATPTSGTRKKIYIEHNRCTARTQRTAQQAETLQ